MALLQGKLQLHKGLAALRSPTPLSHTSEHTAIPKTHESLSATQRAISLLEILERILSFLPQGSLRHIASLVCKDWLALCRPLVVHEFNWTDIPKTCYVTLPISRMAIPQANSRNSSRRKDVSTLGWNFHRDSSSSRSTFVENRAVTVVAEPTWLMKQLENLTTLKCHLSTRTSYVTSTIAPTPNGETAEFPTTTDVVSTTMDVLENRARSDLIKSVQFLTKRHKLSLLELQVDVLDDFDGFLRPMLESTSTLTTLCLKRTVTPILPIGLVLMQCRNLEELNVECEVHSSRPRLVMTLFPETSSSIPAPPSLGGAMGASNDFSHINQGITMDNNQLLQGKRKTDDYQENRLTGNLRLKRFHLKDVLVKESTFMAIMDASPALYELKIQTLDVNPLVQSSPDTQEQEPEEEWVSCDQLEFIQEIGYQYPQLTSVHFTRAFYSYSDSHIRTILQSFPRASRWIIGWRDLPDGILQDLNKCIEIPQSPQLLPANRSALEVYTNHLTSLDIVPSSDWTPRWGNALHEFLCSSPHLEHLRAGTIEYYIENLDLNGLLPASEGNFATFEDDSDERRGIPRGNTQPSHATQDSDNGNQASISTSKPRRIWACRNLKTLHLDFTCQTQHRHHHAPRRSFASTSSVFTFTASSSNSSSSSRFNINSSSSKSEIIHDNSPKLSRIVFGYIARVCPRLQDLLIRGYRLNMTLEGGFCLLTRLRALKKVAISQLDCEFSTKDILPWVMKRKRSMTLMQRLQWWAIFGGWWRLIHGKELRDTAGDAAGSVSTDAVKEAELATSNARAGVTADNGKKTSNSMKLPGLEKLGHLSDVVDVLREIMAAPVALSPISSPFAGT
ncbi:hypothetical protein BGZ80_003615 [Entomortierella chlamydospora]|uniref:F-box domain-containing protein n=1 Tax=Entomortierella chlamydospora TaxID=101097 RepID=A0A9P6T3B8_9FUNG|nr:hypothetical protein BGZ80_003615 [Entomortierella chlamydospora]